MHCTVTTRSCMKAWLPFERAVLKKIFTLWRFVVRNSNNVITEAGAGRCLSDHPHRTGYGPGTLVRDVGLGGVRFVALCFAVRHIQAADRELVAESLKRCWAVCVSVPCSMFRLQLLPLYGAQHGRIQTPAIVTS
jgi:hypothetical protein